MLRLLQLLLLLEMVQLLRLLLLQVCAIDFSCCCPAMRRLALLSLHFADMLSAQQYTMPLDISCCCLAMH